MEKFCLFIWSSLRFLENPNFNHRLFVGMLNLLVFLLFSCGVLSLPLPVFVAERKSLPHEHVVSIIGKQPYECLA